MVTCDRQMRRLTEDARLRSSHRGLCRDVSFVFGQRPQSHLLHARIALMLWYFVLLAVVLVAAGFSLMASGHTRRDLATGRPTFDSVADATGIWNRSHLDDLIGVRDSDDRYTVSADEVRRIPQTFWKRYFDSDVADAGCIICSLIGAPLIRSYPAIAWGLAAVSAAYIVAGYVGAFVVVIRNRP